MTEIVLLQYAFMIAHTYTDTRKKVTAKLKKKISPNSEIY